MEPNKKNSTIGNKGHSTGLVVASLVTASAMVMAVGNRDLLQTHDWLKIALTFGGYILCLFIFGAIGFAAYHTFLTLNANNKKGVVEEEQPRSLVEHIIFWVVFLSIVVWLMLKIGGAV